MIIGGGNVGLEKLNAVVQNSPDAHVRLVSITIREEIYKLAEEHPNIELIERPYREEDLDTSDMRVRRVLHNCI